MKHEPLDGLDDLSRDELLCEIVARHFEGAEVDREAGEVVLGFGDLVLACHVNEVRLMADVHTASLFFALRGGRLGDKPVFASISGYNRQKIEGAIIEGACLWCCTFGPVLRAALASDTTVEVPHFDVEIDGQRFRVYLDSLARGVAFNEPAGAPQEAFAAFALGDDSNGGAWLTRRAIASGKLPLLATDRPTVIGTFVFDLNDQRIVEIKVDGCDWPRMADAFAGLTRASSTGVMLRELAIAVPVSDAPPLGRDAIGRTLRGLAERARTVSGSAGRWLGAVHHDYALGPTLGADAIAALEARVGALPADYRDFLASVAAYGAGPGYGLLSPLAEVQRGIPAGTFAWRDGDAPKDGPTGALCLAHAGCGVMWLLVVAGPHRGEVWVDARSSDSRVHRCAPSFTAWYRSWLATLVRDDRPWTQWDGRGCAIINVLNNVVTDLERRLPAEEVMPELARFIGQGSMATASAGDMYFPPRTPLSPCEGCSTTVDRINANNHLLVIGTELPLDGSPPRPRVAATPDPGGKSTWWSRLRNKLVP